MIGIILIVVGAFSSLFSEELYLTTPQILGGVNGEDGFFFFLGLLFMTIGFVLLFHLYIKIDKYKKDS